MNSAVEEVTIRKNKQKGGLQWWQKFAGKRQEPVVSCRSPLQALK